jgi:ClpP class serine protease
MWLLSEEALITLRNAMASKSLGILDLRLDSANTDVLSINGSLANINVDGVLTTEPDPWMRMVYGANTAYSQIIDAIKTANDNPKVKKIQMNFGRVPGGDAMGIIPVMDAIHGSTKPVEAFVKYQATSGGYGLASQASKITVADRSVVLGSVGVASDMIVFPEEVSITSTEAPDKRPDVTTEEGKAVIRKELDEIHNLFVGAIARGRGVKASEVNANYGRGAIVLAESALAAGMIDKIEARRAAGAKPKAGGKKMEDERTYEMGVAAERQRVASLLALAVVSGDYARAMKDIQSGAELSAEISTHHIEAGIKAHAAKSRISDETPKVTPEVDPGDDHDARVLAAFERRMED